MTPRQRERWEIQKGNTDLRLHEESVSLASVQKKLLYNKLSDVSLNQAAGICTITRVLGHREEMPGSGQWRMITTEGEHCWVCSFHRYTLVFWTEQIGKTNEANNIGIDANEKTRVIKQLKDVNLQHYRDDPTRPMLFSDSTNW